ncbi:MAG: sucrase ferredoxin [Geitlerinemataceae cyanobacterium]
MNPFFCADLSRGAGEDIIGSAPAYQTYIFIECPQPWTTNVWDSKAVPPNLKAFIENVNRSHREIKFLLISADKPNPSSKARVIAFGRNCSPSAGYTRREFRVNMHKVVPLLERYLANPEELALQPPTHRPIRDFFVCTHGSHDKCCSRYGYPFFRQARTIAFNLGLRDVRVWQVSHIGGHRFAPTMISFPDGRYYGALDSESFAAIARRQGDIGCMEKVYRGWGILPRNAQVLERELFLQYGWDWFNYRVSCQILEERPSFLRVELFCEKPGVHSQVYEAELVENEDKTVYLRGSCSSEKVSPFPKFTLKKLRVLSPV